jgi:hypothetical protein
LASGIWNIFARLGLPVVALMILATAGRPGAGLVAAVGLALLAAVAAGLGLLMRSESFAFRAGRALQLALVVACRVPPCRCTGPSPTCPRSPSARSRASRGGTRPALIHAKAAGTGQPTEMSPSGLGPAR